MNESLLPVRNVKNIQYCPNPVEISHCNDSDWLLTYFA